MRFRVTTRALSVLILIIGFALAAFRGANIGWAAASVLAALTALCFATLNAVVRRDRSRPVWLGFALFGWAYFSLHFGPWADWRKGYGPARFTTWAVAGLVLPRLAPQLDGSEFFGGVEEFILLPSGSGAAFFCVAFHSLASVLFGLLGSLAGMTVCRRNDAGVGVVAGESSAIAPTET